MKKSHNNNVGNGRLSCHWREEKSTISCDPPAVEWRREMISHKGAALRKNGTGTAVCRWGEGNQKPESCRKPALFRAMLAALMISGVLAGCSEFMEEPVTDAVPELLSPGDHAETGKYVLDFMWEPVEHAMEYRLQIVTPSFDSVAFYLADTVVQGHRHTLTLEPGKYQWRLRAQNGSSASMYVSRSLTVYRSDLSGQRILQKSPAHDYLTGEPQTDFSWEPIFGVTAYVLQLDTNNFSNEDTLVANEITPMTAITYSLPKEGEYQWRVKGVNDTAQTQWSNARTILYDATPPLPPVLWSPDSNQQVPRPVRLQWRPATDANHYLVYVYRADSTIFDPNQFPQSVRDTTYSFDGGSRREALLWRVRAVDRAGNTSEYSAWRRFILSN